MWRGDRKHRHHASWFRVYLLCLPHVPGIWWSLFRLPDNWGQETRTWSFDDCVLHKTQKHTGPLTRAGQFVSDAQTVWVPTVVFAANCSGRDTRLQSLCDLFSNVKLWPWVWTEEVWRHCAFEKFRNVPINSHVRFPSAGWDLKKEILPAWIETESVRSAGEVSSRVQFYIDAWGGVGATVIWRNDWRSLIRHRPQTTLQVDFKTLYSNRIVRNSCMGSLWLQRGDAARYILAIQVSVTRLPSPGLGLGFGLGLGLGLALRKVWVETSPHLNCSNAWCVQQGSKQFNKRSL